MATTQLLNTLSASFRKDAFSLLLSDALYCKSVIDSIPDDFFDYSPEYSVLFRAYKEFFGKYRNRPKITQLKSYIAKYAQKTNIDDEVVEDVLDLLDGLVKHKNSAPAYTKDSLSNAIIVHNLNEVLSQAKGCIDDGEFDMLLKEVHRARFSGKERSDAVEYWEDIDDRIERRKDISLEVVPTGWKPLDGLMANGGLPRGGIGMIMAASGRGKSAYMGDMAVRMSRKGYIGAYLTLELSASEVMTRFDSAVSGVPLAHVPKKANKVSNAIKAAMQNPTNSITPANLYVQYSPTKSIGIGDIESFIDDLRIKEGISLDFLVVDYFDLLKMEGSYTDRTVALEENMEMLRGIAGKNNMVIWTASQTNRGGVNKEDVDMGDIASSYAKVFPMDMLLIVNQTKEERENGIFRLKIEKSRSSVAGTEIWVKGDFSTMKFEFFTEEEAEDLDLTSNSPISSASSVTAPSYKKKKKRSGPANSFMGSSNA